VTADTEKEESLSAVLSLGVFHTGRCLTGSLDIPLVSLQNEEVAEIRPYGESAAPGSLGYSP
jgi:hypothetical protein